MHSLPFGSQQENCLGPLPPNHDDDDDDGDNDDDDDDDDANEV
jgi:hypothetical protein